MGGKVSNNTINSTTQDACNEFADLLVASGVTCCVLSAGSRNAPLLVALTRRKELRCTIIEDERTAGFYGLGLSIQKSAETISDDDKAQKVQPVVLACTSGSALLNYAPAVSEAYYQRIPLIVLSADRPEEWIDQDDSQTIRQYGAIGNIVEKSYDIPSRYDSDAQKWYVNRMLNEAINLAFSKSQPVHINFHFAEPLYDTHDYERGSARKVTTTQAQHRLCCEDIVRLQETYRNASRVMIVGGFGRYSQETIESVRLLSMLDNTVVLTETIANIPTGDSRVIRTIDKVISTIAEETEDEFMPELLISFGGSWVSRMLKGRLRKGGVKWHWHISEDDEIVDVTTHLSEHIQMSADDFFPQLVSKGILQGNAKTSLYASQWREWRERAQRLHDEYIKDTVWCDLKAFSIISELIEGQVDTLHLSNGTPIRYAQLFGEKITIPTYCNRGVSGIDGCTSTALGASSIINGTTLLITGDMSFCYDIGALASGILNPYLKIIVINNGGGGIFRFIKGPDTLPELENCFVINRKRNIKGIATTFDYEYFEAGNERDLRQVFAEFIQCNSPAILGINTTQSDNAGILRGYFKRGC